MRQTAKKDEIVYRREKVARLRLRGLTIREIAEALGKIGIDVDHATVGRDIQALDAEWRASAAAVVDDHKARLLAELSEVKRHGWSKEKLRYVLDAIRQEADILGLNAPIKGDFTSNGQTIGTIGALAFIERTDVDSQAGGAAPDTDAVPTEQGAV